jgi:prepilin-type N-terminal cleavage/methylation domain-containing protein
MQMTHLHLIVSRLRDPRGFTLIEVLVAMIAGTIVLGALVLILEITINQTSRIDETAQVNQAGRTTMTKIVDELQSACLETKFAPIQAKSTEDSIRFAAAFTEKADIAYSEAAIHKIEWNSTAQTLTESRYAGTSGENGKIVFSETPESTTTRLGEKITQGESGGKVPIFRYYRYRPSGATSGTEAPEEALEEISPGSETTELGTKASEVAAVDITFKTGAKREELLHSETKAVAAVPSEISDQVTFAFSAPTSESTIADGPCQ